MQLNRLREFREPDRKGVTCVHINLRSQTCLALLKYFGAAPCCISQSRVGRKFKRVEDDRHRVGNILHDTGVETMERPGSHGFSRLMCAFLFRKSWRRAAGTDKVAHRYEKRGQVLRQGHRSMCRAIRRVGYAIPILQPKQSKGRAARSFRSVSYKAVCFYAHASIMLIGKQERG